MILDHSSVDLAGSGQTEHDNLHACPLNSLLSESSVCRAVFKCTHQTCPGHLIATYKSAWPEANRTAYHQPYLAAHKPQEASFSETIHEVSPAFIEIYSQSLSAEAHELHQVVGIGLRKALEFLVKDFACHQNPGKDNEIRATPLGSCISSYLIDPNLTECVQGATWLGNDEAHYTRKWETKDIDDLKLFVRLTVNWVENVLLSQKYLAKMGEGKA